MNLLKLILIFLAGAVIGFFLSLIVGPLPPYPSPFAVLGGLAVVGYFMYLVTGNSTSRPSKLATANCDDDSKAMFNQWKAERYKVSTITVIGAYSEEEKEEITAMLLKHYRELRHGKGCVYLSPSGKRITYDGFLEDTDEVRLLQTAVDTWNLGKAADDDNYFSVVTLADLRNPVSLYEIYNHCLERGTVLFENKIPPYALPTDLSDDDRAVYLVSLCFNYYMRDRLKNKRLSIPRTLDVAFKEDR